MQEIILKREHWRLPEDFYKDLFQALGIPAWVSRDREALKASIIEDINAVTPPYKIVIVTPSNLESDPEMLRTINDFSYLVDELEGCGITVGLEYRRRE